MRRESARTVGSGCQTGHSRHYPRIEDQGAEDQQEPLQGDRSLEKPLAKADCNTRNITKFVILNSHKNPSFSAAYDWCLACLQRDRTECSELAGKRTGT